MITKRLLRAGVQVPIWRVVLTERRLRRSIPLSVLSRGQVSFGLATGDEAACAANTVALPEDSGLGTLCGGACSWLTEESSCER